MSSREDEDAWAEIIAHYGERASLPEDPPTAPGVPPVAPPVAPPVSPPVSPPVASRPPAYGGDELAAGSADLHDEGRFIPPVPPPIPRPKGPRLMAWLGVLGVPVLLVVVMLLTLELPPSITSLLVVWFLGGFLYLVSQMPRQRDDPWDDGAVL